MAYLISNFLSRYFSHEFLTVFLSAVPIVEMRGAIPIAILRWHIAPRETLLLALAGNISAIVIAGSVLYAIAGFLMRRSYFFNRFLHRLFEYTRRRHVRKFDRFKELALVILVAIPLPFSGAWTGILAAYVFGISVRRMIVLASIGSVISAMLILILTLELGNILNF